eukprot:scaffold253856_cov19-Tisochrysis_lutea.AAC.1
MSNPHHQALDKLGCWLLANLTTPLGSSVREQLLLKPSTLAHLVHLARPGQPEPVIVLACNVLGNLVREAVPCKPRAHSSGLTAHDVLARAGALEVLQAHAQTPQCSSKVRTAKSLPSAVSSFEVRGGGDPRTGEIGMLLLLQTCNAMQCNARSCIVQMMLV